MRLLIVSGESNTQLVLGTGRT